MYGDRPSWEIKGVLIESHKDVKVHWTSATPQGRDAKIVFTNKDGVVIFKGNGSLNRSSEIKKTILLTKKPIRIIERSR
jgi:hypothetical protein